MVTKCNVSCNRSLISWPAEYRHSRHRFQSNTKIYYEKYSEGDIVKWHEFVPSKMAARRNGDVTKNIIKLAVWFLTWPHFPFIELKTLHKRWRGRVRGSNLHINSISLWRQRCAWRPPWMGQSRVLLLNTFRHYWVIIRPFKEQIQCIKIYSAFWVPKTLK